MREIFQKKLCIRSGLLKFGSDGILIRNMMSDSGRTIEMAAPQTLNLHANLILSVQKPDFACACSCAWTSRDGIVFLPWAEFDNLNHNAPVKRHKTAKAPKRYGAIAEYAWG